MTLAPIIATQHRLNRLRRINSLLPLGVIALLVVLGIVTLSLKYKIYSAILFCVAAFLGWKNRSLVAELKPIPLDEAAKFIDFSLGSRSRLLTLISLETKLSPSEREFIWHQTEPLLKYYSPEQLIPIKLSKASQFSIPAICLLVVLIGLLEFSTSHSKLTPYEQAQATRIADEIRELASVSPAISESLKDSLLDLADAVESEGLTSDETLEEIQQAKNEIKEEEQKQLQESHERKNEFVENRRDSHNSESSSSGEGSKQEVASRNENNQSGESNNNTQPDLTESENNKQEGGSNQNEGQQSAGDTHSDKTHTNNPQANDGSGDSLTPDDPRKDVTGVGSGKGKGNDGGKEQHGESRSGTDDSKAKDGAAENALEGEKESQAQPKKQNNERGNNPGQEGNRTKLNQGAAPSAGKEKNGAAPKGSANEQLSQIKQELEKVEQQAKGEKDSQGEKKTGEDSKQSSPGNKPGEKPGESGDKLSSKQSGEKKSGESGKKNEQGESGEKSRTAGKSEEQGESGEKSRTAGKSEEQGKESDASLKRPNDVPDENETAERFGSGGENNKNSGTLPTERVGLELPSSSSVLVRNSGAEDPQLIKNPNQNPLKTQIGSQEFTHAPPEEPRGKQPIPLEYRDAIH